MRRDELPSEIGRWEWYARGDGVAYPLAARKSQTGSEDNSSEQVLWECGLVIVVPLAFATLVEVVLRLTGI